MNQSVIKEFTGQGDDILEDCQRKVNVEKKIDINRHINFTMRSIETYDVISVSYTHLTLPTIA